MLHKKNQERIKRAYDFIHDYPDFVSREERWLIPLVMLGLELSDEGRDELNRRFGWKPVQWPVPVNEALGKLSRQRFMPSQLAELLDQLPPPLIAALVGLAKHNEVRDRVVRYLDGPRPEEALISGHHLLEAGVAQGREVAYWKNRALAAQRDGEFEDLPGAMEWLSQNLSLERL